MIVSEEMEGSIESGFDTIAKFEITYKNGGKVLGTAKRIKYSPLKITILKDPVPKGESSKHKVVIDHVIKFSLLFKDGTSKSFE